MRIRPGRLLVVLFLLGFTMFFGLDLATRGMERVQGPREEASKPASVAHQPESRPSVAPAGTGKTASATKAGEAQGVKANGGKASAPPAKSTSAPGTVKKASAASADQVTAGPIGQVEESFMNHLCNRIGDALQKGAKALISLVVSVFDSVIN